MCRRQWKLTLCAVALLWLGGWLSAQGVSAPPAAGSAQQKPGSAEAGSAAAPHPPAEPAGASAMAAPSPDSVALTLAGKPLTVAEYSATLQAAGAPAPLNLGPAERRREAESYTNLVALSALARRRGLDQSPEMQQRLKFEAERMLAAAAYRDLARQATEVPAQSLVDYYNQHPSEFDQLHLQRLFIRKTGTDATSAQTKAADLQKRAAAGVDMDQLAKELAGATAAASSDIGLHTPGTLGMSAENDALVFRLKPGEVSPVLEETGGFFIYKATERKHMSQSDATPVIRQKLATARLNSELEKARQDLGVQLNSAFFDAPAQPRANPPSLKPPAQQSPNPPGSVK